MLKEPKSNRHISGL